jgi:hypothetical protein
MRFIKIRSLILVLLSVTITACIPAKVVTLIGPDGPQYFGSLEYSDGLSGVLTVQNGPLGESFTGRYTVIDRTAVGQSQGTLVMPGNSTPTIGATGSSSSGNVDASGYWYAVGDKGSTMQCDLVVGRQGHGRGTCKHSNGNVYQIVM